MATKSTPPTALQSSPIKLEPQEQTHTNQNHQNQPPIASVAELRNLNAALSAFLSRYDELQGHLDLIQTSIDSKLPPNLNAAVPSSIVPQIETQLAVVLPSSTESPTVAKSETKPTDNTTSESNSELENLCKLMCSRGLRKYLVTNLSNADKLREEAPRALMLAPNQAKLVLECFGRFYLQGIKAYTKDSPMVGAREASVLVLECFLLNDGIDIEPALKEEAEAAAVAWKKRLNSEGGLGKACEADARGLLFLISCFGIPDGFTGGDFRNLFRASNVRQISGALRLSSRLVAKVTEMIERMVKDKSSIEALDFIRAFEIEDRFPPQTILTSILRESKETWKKSRKAAQGSLPAMNEANKKKLEDLRSVNKYLEDHKIDPFKLLPGWRIKENILNLEKEIADLDEKAREKRKADEIESLKKMKTQQAKRPRFGHADDRRSYDGFPGHISSYSASPSVLHGSAVSLLPENNAGSVARNGGALLGVGFESGLLGGVLPSDRYAGIHGGMHVDTVGQMAVHNPQPYRWGDAALNERLVGYYAGQTSSVGINSLYKPQSSLEGFAGLPNPTSGGVSSRSSAADLYQFADAVVEHDSYRDSGSRAGATPPVFPGRHASYLY